MKVTLDRKILHDALAALGRMVPPRTTIPILGHVKMVAENGRLTLFASDLDMEMRLTLAAEVSSSGMTTVPASRLREVAARARADAPVLIEQTGTALAVRSGRSRFTLPTLPAGDFPHFDGGAPAVTFTMPAAQLGALMARTAFAVNEEESRYCLCGIFLHARDGKLRAVATNGHVMARFDTPLPPGAEAMPAIVVPFAAARELQKIGAGDVAARVSVSPSRIAVTVGDCVLTSKLIDAIFPDYARVIPQGNDKALTVDAAECAAAVLRMQAVMSERGRAVRLSLSESGLVLSTRADDAAAEDAIDGEFDGDPLDIGLNSGYLAAALEALDCGTLRMQFADPGSPVLLQSAANADFLVVIMPMRV